MKRFVTILLTVILVTATAVTGVFADSLTPLPVVNDNTYNTLVQQGVQVNSGSWYSVYMASIDSNTTDLFIGAVPNPDISGYYNYYAGCLSASQAVRFNNSASSTTVKALSGNDLDQSFYYAMVTSSPNLPTSNCPIYPTLADFCSAVANPTTGEVFDFTLPAGYALVIQGECSILERNFSITNSWDFARSDSYRVNGSSERLLAIGNVVDSFSPDKNLARSALIQWQALNANIQGNASNYSFSANDLVTVPSGACFVISYPTLYGYGTAYPANATISHENSVDLTGNVYLQYSGDRPTLRVVALESLSEYSSSGQFSTYSVFRPAVKDEVLSPSGVSTDGHTILVPSSPLPSGGGNSGQPPVSEDDGFLGTISNFLNDIKNLLSTGSHAVVELVTYGASFMSAIASMYNWLPATLSTLIITAFTVVLVIGVIKLLWK